MTIKWLASAFLWSGLVYCGGGSGGGSGGSSGVNASKTLGELSSSEMRDLCEYIASLEEQPERDIDCGDGLTISTGINADDVQAQIEGCVNAPSPTCTATVGDAETCLETIAGFSDDELCQFFTSQTPLAECATLFTPECT